MSRANQVVDPSKPETIPKFADSLPIPATANPKLQNKDGIFYQLEMKEIHHQFHQLLPKTRVWGYDGMYPGPTNETDRDQSVYVEWVNRLPDDHLFPIDRTLHGTMDHPEVRTVVHLHGAHVSADSDGYPEAWYTRDYTIQARLSPRRSINIPTASREPLSLVSRSCHWHYKIKCLRRPCRVLSDTGSGGEKTEAALWGI